MTQTEAYNTVRNYIITDDGNSNQYTRGAMAGLDALVKWINCTELELAVANARIAELETAIEDSAYSPIEIVSLADAFDTLTDYFNDVLLWNEPEFVEGRAAVDTVRFTISENDKRIAELEAQVDAADYRIANLEAQLAAQRTPPIHEVIDDFGETVTAVTL